MPTNFFEQQNEFYIVDVDSVFLGSPITSVQIRQPKDFGKINIKLSRGKESHGFNYESFDEEHQIGIHRKKYTGETYSGYDVVLGIYNAAGVDGKCNLEYYENGVLTHVFSLHMETIVIHDYQIRTQARSVTLDDKFRTRYDMEVSMDATESIDGDTITPPTAQSMFLHSKQINQVALLTLIDPVSVDQSDMATDAEACFLSFGYDDTDFNEPEFEVNNGKSVVFQDSGSAATTGVSTLWPYTLNSNGLSASFGSYFYFPIPLLFDYTIYFNVKITGRLISNASQQFIRIFLRDLSVLPDPTPDPTIAVVVYEDDVTNDTLEFDIDEDVTFTKTTADAADSQIKLQVHMGPGSSPGDYIFEIDTCEITATMITFKDNSLADVYETRDCFNHVLNSITGQTSLLESSFFDDDIPDAFLTNGYKIRNVPDKSLYLSFENLFDKWAMPLFGLGYQVYNDSGNFKVLIERYSHFYQDVEIDYIEDIFDGTFEIFPDQELFANEIVTGSSKYPSSTDENTQNNLDEFNTKHLHSIPIVSVKKKKEYVSETILSGYKIENQRREQFKERPQETVSDDDDAFAIKGIESDRYEDVFMTFLITVDILSVPGRFYNLSVGEVFTISGSAANNTTFTIEQLEHTEKSTLIHVAETVSFEIANNVNIIKSSSFLRAERDEPFDSVTGLVSPETAYNIGFNPKNMLLNQSPLFLSGLNRKPDTELVKTQRVFLNDQMEFEFSTGEGDYVLGAGTAISMTGDLQLSDINLNTKIFSGDRVKFKCRLSYPRIKNIRLSCLNEHPTTSLGYVRVKDYNGVDWKIFIDELIYSLLSEEVEIEGRVKYEE